MYFFQHFHRVINESTFCTQVFSSAKVFFSIGGKRFNRGEPITYEYIEDKIFETARNITIKLHHRVGKFVKLQLFFAAKWIMLSEISFDAAIAHGNFLVEPDPTTVPPPIRSHNSGERHDQNKIEIPIPNEINEPAVIAVILIGQ